MSTDANAQADAPAARSGKPKLGHIRGLDGIRAVAVLGLIASHTFAWIPGGFYGVDAFFVLSGYLITTLLTTEWRSTGTIVFRRFWAGRARRLLPALFLMVVVLGIVLLAFPKVLATPHVIGDALSTVFYASNWYQVQGHVGYFQTGLQPSPLEHTWSLAIEEQFYLVWPIIVLVVLKLGTGARAEARRARRARRGRRQSTVRVLDGGYVTLIPLGSAAPDPVWTRRRRLHILFALSSFGALASSLAMVVLAPSGYTSRAYFGTDTRAQALLVGAAIASGLALWQPEARRWFRRLAGVLGLAGMVGTGLLWAVADQNSVFAFSGGFLLAALAAGGIVLCAAVNTRAPSIWLLEIPPIPWLGQISYGIYLWYWPVLLVMTASRVPHDGLVGLFLEQVAVMIALAAASAYLVELPIRRGALSHWRSWVAAPLGAGAAIGAVMASTLVPVGATAVPSATGSTTTTTTTTTPGAPPTTTTTFVPVPTAMSPQTPTVARTHRVKVLLVGDSIAGSLAPGLAQYESNDDVQIVNEGIPGCSVAMDQQIKVLFYTLPPGLPCAAGDPSALLSQWKRWIDTYNPDVVLYVARGETFNQEHNGAWVDIGQPSFDRYIESRYREAVSVLGSRGATVVLMTSPYYSSGDSPTGTIWPEDTPSRVVLDNQTIHRVATSSTSGPGHNTVYVFNLNALVSPGDHYDGNLGPVNLRCNDGVHFSRPGGVFIGLQLLPDVADLGQAHAAGSPGGAWSGPLPTPTPPWYQKLNCQ